MELRFDHQCLRCRGHLRPFGWFFRRSDGSRIKRYRCVSCKKTASRATYDACYRQKKRQKNEPLRKLLVSGVSQRRAAKILRVNPKTVTRKFQFLAQRAELSNRAYFEDLRSLGGIKIVEFDEMETHEHTKLKPLSIPLVVTHPERKILGFDVAQMPAKGLLAQKSREKYGPREDHREKALQSLLESIKPILGSSPTVKSDESPRYPKIVKEIIPNAIHETYKGRRGAVVGQGELKKIGFDPIFSLNHTAAMIRANINRLFRRTWCTTKKPERLKAHLALYVEEHNQVLTEPIGLAA